MLPGVVHVALAYAAGGWLGYHWGPAGILLALVTAALALVPGTRGWAVLAGLAAVAAFSGGMAGRRDGSCDRAWAPGSRVALLQVYDAPGERGLAQADVMHATPACRTRLRLRFRSPETASSEVGWGAVILAVGSYRTGGVLRVDHYRVLDRAPPWRAWLRGKVSHRIAGLYGRRAPVVEALVLGRREDVPPELRREFAGAGLAHLLAISGLHVGIFAGWLVWTCQRLGTRARLLVPLGGVWIYVAVLGLPAPATRAAIFLSVMLAGSRRQRHPARSAVLAVGVLGVLLLDPGAVVSAGAWLSFAAVWGTSAASGLLRGRWRRFPPAQLAAASVGATVATAPITAYVFGTVALVGALSNLVAVPLAGLIVPSLFVSLALPGVAASAGLGLAALERLAAFAAHLPAAQWRGVPGWSGAWPWVLVLVVVARWVRRPPTWSAVRRRLVFAAALSGWLYAAVDWRARTPDGILSVFVLDVGQGDAIAVRTPRGRWLLVDAGPLTGFRDAGWEVVVPFLRRQGVDRLSLVFVSHGDADHLGGVPAVVRALSPEVVVEPGQPQATGLYGRYLAAVEGSDLAWRVGRRGDTVVVDSVSMAVLHPSAEWMARHMAPNENSLVLHLRYGCFDALLTGDIGAEAEAHLLPSVGPVEFLKVGHHGSAGGTGDAWLAALRPAISVISVGAGNRYGHPAPEVLERLGRWGSAVFRTDRDGPVTARTDGRYLDVWSGGLASRLEEWLCRMRHWLRSSDSFSSKSGCTRGRRVSLPICSTISR